jgi:hypothetical protein
MMTTRDAFDAIQSYLSGQEFDSFLDVIEYLDINYSILPNNIRIAYDIVVGEYVEYNSREIY